jgi:hypothetical protein
LPDSSSIAYCSSLPVLIALNTIVPFVYSLISFKEFTPFVGVRLIVVKAGAFKDLIAFLFLLISGWIFKSLIGHRN